MLWAILNEYSLRGVFADYGVSSGRAVTGRKTESFNGFCCLILCLESHPVSSQKESTMRVRMLGVALAVGALLAIGSVKGDDKAPPP